MTLPDNVQAFNKELAEMLKQKPPVSSSKMRDITKSAMKAQKYYKHIVMSVEKLIQKCKPEFKLSGVYVIDAIVRQSRHQNSAEKDNFGPRFEVNLPTTAKNLFTCSQPEQVKICRTFKLWEINGVFSYHTIQKCLNNTSDNIKQEGINLAEAAKMQVKPVSGDLLKQQKEIEEQKKLLLKQQEDLKKKQEELLSSTAEVLNIPPILNNLLQLNKTETNADSTKVKSLLDDFDYSEDEGENKKTPKVSSNKHSPSTQRSTSENNKPSIDPYSQKVLDLYTPSPVENRSKDSSKSRKEKRKSEKSRDRERRRSKDRSRERRSSRSKSDDRKRGKRYRSTSPEYTSKSKSDSIISPGFKSSKHENLIRPDCVTVLTTTVWIGNLRKTVSKDDISSLIKNDPVSIDMVPPRGCAFINAVDRDVAESVLRDLKDQKLHGSLCKVAWAPGKGCKEFVKEYWNVDKGATFIPYRTFQTLKVTQLEEGGSILKSTLPAGFKIQETEGPGTILEKLLVSMKENTKTSTPLGQFLYNGNENIAKKEQDVNAKLDKLNDIEIPSQKVDKKDHIKEEESIVSLLNSNDCLLPGQETDNDYQPDDPGMSPPEFLNLPKGTDSPDKAEEATLEQVNTQKDDASPDTLPEEPMPYSRTTDSDSATLPQPIESPKPEKKTINLQTYLKRKKDDDVQTESKKVDDNNFIDMLDTESFMESTKDFIQGKTEPSDEIGSKPTTEKTVLDPEDSFVQAITELRYKSPVVDVNSKAIEDTCFENDASKENDSSQNDVSAENTNLNDGAENESNSNIEVQTNAEQEEVLDENIDVSSPVNSPVDSLLEEKLASPSVKKKSPSPEPPPRSRSTSKPKNKKEKKKKKRKKKRGTVDSDLEEDIRKLEILKAELEREERREKREKERRKQKERSKRRSPSPYKEKRKKCKH